MPEAESVTENQRTNEPVEPVRETILEVQICSLGSGMLVEVNSNYVRTTTYDTRTGRDARPGRKMEAW